MISHICGVEEQPVQWDESILEESVSFGSITLDRQSRVAQAKDFFAGLAGLGRGFVDGSLAEFYQGGGVWLYTMKLKDR